MARITKEDRDAAAVLRSVYNLAAPNVTRAAARLAELREKLGTGEATPEEAPDEDKPKKKRKAKTGEDRMEEGGVDRSVE
jgi:hypothetical protein